MKINKKILKVLIVILMLVVAGLFITNNSFATWDMHIEDYDDADITSAGRAGNTITSIMGAVINLATIVGSGVAIIMLIVIGVQYVTKGADGKADAKKDLEGYVIGAVILFGVSGILKLLQMFIDSNLNKI